VHENYSFCKENRLVNQAQFKAVRSFGVRVRNPLCIVNACKNELNYPRIGIITSKKSLPKAVTRNKVRRIVKEWFRYRIKKLPSLDIIVIMSFASRYTTTKELHLCLDKLLQRVEKQCKL
jgi:ribonuclease P protein component